MQDFKQIHYQILFTVAWVVINKTAGNMPLHLLHHKPNAITQFSIGCLQSINQSINQSVSQSNYQPTNQPINQSIDQSVNQIITQNYPAKGKDPLLILRTLHKKLKNNINTAI